MPFGVCPVCGVTYHLNVSLPVDEWYRKYHPEIPFGEVIRSECLLCGIELRVGHQVRVRVVPPEHAEAVAAGDRGVIAAANANGEFAVRLDNGKGTRTFNRHDLWYVAGQPALPDPN